MIFGKKKDWDDQYDDRYVARSDREVRTGRSTVWIHVVSLGVTAGLLLAATGLISGQTMFEKSLIALASPVGMVWLLLMVLIYFGFLFRQPFFALLALLCWMLLTVFGNSFVANQLIYWLEKPYLETSVATLEKLDVVFVLGGGTTSNLQGQAQAGCSGDRIVTAAKLFHDDQVALIVCTGQQWNRVSELDLHPHEEAARLLAGLDIPESAIAMIAGSNTAEEMQLAATFIEQQQLSNRRIGIITSAFHLNRAERLARKQGLNPIMIPSDFRSGFFTTGPNLLIPSAASLDQSGLCLKEYLARWLGR